MSQQINLYQPILRRQRKVFSAATMLQVVGVVALGLLLLFVFGRWQEASVRGTLDTLQQQRVAAQAQFDRISAELAARRDTRELDARLQQAEQELAARRRLLRWLGEHGSDPGAGFAAHLEGLARQHRPGLRLESIAIAAGGRQVRLGGHTSEAGELVRYLRRLGEEPAFAGLEFRTVRLDRGRDDAALVGFVVDSEREEAAR